VAVLSVFTYSSSTESGCVPGVDLLRSRWREYTKQVKTSDVLIRCELMLGWRVILEVMGAVRSMQSSRCASKLVMGRFNSSLVVVSSLFHDSPIMHDFSPAILEADCEYLLH
jgi:hypothetical protein